MSIVFPDYPLIAIDTYQEEPTDIALRTEMDRGVPKQRRTQSDVMITVPLRLIFVMASDAENFETWFYSASGANLGMNWFEWTDPRTGDLRTARAVANTLGPLARLPEAADFNLTGRTLKIEYLRVL